MIPGLAVIPVPAAAAAGCHWGLPTALPVPAGFTGVTVSATDGEEAFAGNAFSYVDGSFDRNRAVVWQGGQVSLLPTPDGYSSGAGGMNRLGDVVGYVTPTAGGTSTPALWRAGMLIQLGTASPSADATAYDINDAGLIVGYMRDLGFGYSQAVAWSADAPGTFSYVPGGSTTALYSVTEGGQLAGTAVVTDDTGRPVGTQAMTGTVDAGLHPLPGPVPGANTDARAAAGSYIVGYYNVVDEGRALSWRNEQPQVLSTTGSNSARGVNSQGTATGGPFAATGRPLVWMNGVEQQLPLILPGRHLTYGAGSVVTEHNVVGGSVREVFDQDIPVYWRCR
jgi:uncharacterized membrane protein